MRTCGLTINPHFCAVVNCLKMQANRFPTQLGRQGNLFPVPGHPLIVLLEFLQGSRNGYLFNILVTKEILSLVPIRSTTFVILVENNVPNTVERICAIYNNFLLRRKSYLTIILLILEVPRLPSKIIKSFLSSKVY